MLGFIKGYLEDIATSLNTPLPTLYIDGSEYTDDKINGLRISHWRKKEKTDFSIQTPDGNNIHRFTLVPMPGCCAFVISTKVRTFHGFRQKGVNKRSLEFRIRLAEYLHYSGIICTHIRDNVAEFKTLESQNFEKAGSVDNIKTGNTVYLRLREIDPDPIPITDNTEVAIYCKCGSRKVDFCKDRAGWLQCFDCGECWRPGR